MQPELTIGAASHPDEPKPNEPEVAKTGEEPGGSTPDPATPDDSAPDAATIEPATADTTTPDPAPPPRPAKPEPDTTLTRPPPPGWQEVVRRHRRPIIVTAVVATLLLPVTWSYVGSVTRPSNQSLGVRSVEWLKDNHFRWFVNDFENFWYSHHKPKKGGVPNGRAQGLIQSGPPSPVASTKPVTPTPLRHLPPPLPIPPVIDPALPGEGQWHPLGQLVNGVPAMYAAYIRPDPVYSGIYTGVAWIDPLLTRAALYAGFKDPGGRNWRYQAPIALADRPDLLAAFNSGFQLRDSASGYYAEGRIVKALKDGAATLVIHADGTWAIGTWGQDVQMAPDVMYARQNLSLLVDNGQPVPSLDTDNFSKWGATFGNKTLVWRSGLGITNNGALVYAGGNNLSAASLARVLAHAGAIRAMELDINSAWVAFFTYAPAPPGLPPGDLAVTKLMPDMRSSTSRFFTNETRDFIAIFRRH